MSIIPNEDVGLRDWQQRVLKVTNQINSEQHWVHSGHIQNILDSLGKETLRASSKETLGVGITKTRSIR